MKNIIFKCLFIIKFIILEHSEKIILNYYELLIRPIIHTCQHCEKRILTEVEHQTTWIGIASCFLLLIIFKIFAIPLIIMIIPLTQQTTHTCSNCLNVVGIRTFYDIFALRDNIVSFQIGNFAILISRKQLLGVFLFILFALFFWLFLSNLNFKRGSKYIFIYK